MQIGHPAVAEILAREGFDWICVDMEHGHIHMESMTNIFRALAAYDGDEAVTTAQLKKVANMSLGHRLRRNPLDESSAGVRVERVVNEVLAE